MVSAAAALMLADARLPAGGHAHSAQLEAAAAAGTVTDVPSLELFLLGRLRHAALTPAAFSAHACSVAVNARTSWTDIDAELTARIPSPAQRLASRHQGRTLLRAATPAWPSVALAHLAGLPGGPHHAVALGAVAAAADASPDDAALVSTYQAITTPASAAVRLLGLDPLAVNACLASLLPHVEAVARTAVFYAGRSPRQLPCMTAPVLDVLAEHHALWEVRLFAS